MMRHHKGFIAVSLLMGSLLVSCDQSSPGSSSTDTSATDNAGTPDGTPGGGGGMNADGWPDFDAPPSGRANQGVIVKGEFVGGCDIITEMTLSGEMDGMFEQNGISFDKDAADKIREANG